MDSAQPARKRLSNLAFSVQKLGWWLRYRGLGDVAAELLERAKRSAAPRSRALDHAREERDKDFDRRAGVNTTGWIAPDDLAGQKTGGRLRTAEQYSGYQAVDSDSFIRAINRLSIDLSSYTFIDYVSGK